VREREDPAAKTIFHFPWWPAWHWAASDPRGTRRHCRSARCIGPVRSNRAHPAGVGGRTNIPHKRRRHNHRVHDAVGQFAGRVGRGGYYFVVDSRAASRVLGHHTHRFTHRHDCGLLGPFSSYGVEGTSPVDECVPGLPEILE